MTVTLELAPDTEAALPERAALQGISVESYLQQVVQNALPAPTLPSERKARAQSLAGSLAYLGPSTLIADKAEEKSREARAWQSE